MKYALEDFIVQCKINYFKHITPAIKSMLQNEFYQKLIKIPVDFFSNKKIDEFAKVFSEGEYYLELWAAHLILEYGKPNNGTKNRAVEIIRKYSQSPLSPFVAEEERSWIRENLNEE